MKTIKTKKGQIRPQDGHRTVYVIAETNGVMNNKVTEESSLARKADAAFLKASYKVVQRAKETGTPVIIWEDDQIKEIPADEMEMRMNAAYNPESTP